MVTSQPAEVSWLPPAFVTRMRAWLGDEGEAFFAALAHRDVGLRLNPQRGPVEALAAALPWATGPVPWCAEGRVLRADLSSCHVPSGEVSIGAHPYHTAGVYYVQDPSAMAAAVLLDPRPGEWVLDLAAAPGSKATHIAARLQGEGVLVANEVSRRRATVLAMNLERMGATNAIVTNAYPDRLAASWAGLFDAMLVDAPCSGEGTFAWDPHSLQEWSLATVRSYAGRQKRILAQAADLVRPGGRLLYGTCTFSPEENEGVIAAFLAERPDFELMDMPRLPGMGPGRPEWLRRQRTGGRQLTAECQSTGEDGTPGGIFPDLRRAGRYWPHTGPGHGHFFALMRRQGERPDDLPARWTDEAIPGRVLRLYQTAMGEVLQDDPPEAGLYLTRDDQCYVTPMEPALLDLVPVLRPGWWVASLRHNRVQPDHALAMALGSGDVRASVRLLPDDPRVDRFLDGGFWADTGPVGHVLVTVDGFPLGWGKRDGKRLRSRYPVHLRKARAG